MKQKEYQEEEFNKYRKETVHFILAHSYFIFLLAIILGVLFDTFFKNTIFSNNIYKNLGFFMLITGSVFIYWAQSTSANFRKRIEKNENKSHFEFGPYKYLRSPTHFGLFIMTIGYSLIINSLFSIIFTLAAYTITKFFFIKKEEKLLEKKYGEDYAEYKKKVKNWI